MKSFSISTEHGGRCAAQANGGTELLFGGNHTEVRLIEELMVVARSVWPRKTAAELASRLGVSTRAAEKWLAHDGGMSGEQHAGLLRCEHGLKFLRATVPADRVLWKDWAREMRRAELEAQINALQQEYSDRYAETK